MSSFALGAFIIFILYVIIWSIRNDGAASIGEQTGYIRMRDPSRDARKPAGAQYRSRQAAPPQHRGRRADFEPTDFVGPKRGTLDARHRPRS